MKAVASEPVERELAATDGGAIEAAYADSGGRKKPMKKWLGIW